MEFGGLNDSLKLTKLYHQKSQIFKAFLVLLNHASKFVGIYLCKASSDPAANLLLSAMDGYWLHSKKLSNSLQCTGLTHSVLPVDCNLPERALMELPFRAKIFY